MEWFVFPHVSQGEKTVFDFLSALLLFLSLLLFALLFELELLVSLFLFPGLVWLFSVCSRCFFQQATLIPEVSRFFTVVARWFGFVRVTVCGLLAHIVYR